MTIGDGLHGGWFDHVLCTTIYCHVRLDGIEWMEMKAKRATSVIYFGISWVVVSVFFLSSFYFFSFLTIITIHSWFLHLYHLRTRSNIPQVISSLQNAALLIMNIHD